MVKNLILIKISGQQMVWDKKTEESWAFLHLLQGFSLATLKFILKMYDIWKDQTDMKIQFRFWRRFKSHKKYDTLLAFLIILAQVSEAEENDTDEFCSCEYIRKSEIDFSCNGLFSFDIFLQTEYSLRRDYIYIKTRHDLKE